jgi:hypothetical protein
LEMLSWGVWEPCIFLSIIVRVSTHWSSWWHGGFGSIEIVVFEGSRPNFSSIMWDIRDEAKTHWSCIIIRVSSHCPSLVLFSFCVFFCCIGHALLRGYLNHLDSLFFFFFLA